MELKFLLLYYDVFEEKDTFFLLVLKLTWKIFNAKQCMLIKVISKL
jgi:hypothetical protein